MSSDVRFRILGSVGVSIDGAPLTAGASRQRALLALLLLDAYRRVHPHLLIDGIWGEACPQHPEAALQIVVSRLRSSLGPLAERLSSDPSGYRIEVGEGELDHLRARAHFRCAQELFAEHDQAGAASAAEAALACWSSDALADLRDAPFYDSAHRGLRELRFEVYELRNRAYLRCGRHLEVLVDIDTWIRSDPWRERLRAHQMIALYRAGRRVEALAAYADLADCLREDLGVEPSHFVRELQTRIVEQDPELLAHRAGIVAPLPAWTPCSLPFVGRSQEETRIFNFLRTVAGGTSRMVLIEGEAGIGKSRLALETARRVHDEAIVLAVDGADALRPGLHMIAAALAEASAQLSDTELRLCLGRWPGDIAELVPSLRRRLPDLPAALDADDETRAARLRAAVVSWIGALSQRAPVLLMLDDLHRAGPALLLLIGAVLVDEEPKRVLVLATARSGAGDRSSRLEQLARSLEQRGLFERIALTGLTPEAVGHLLDELALPDAATLAARLIASTRGHPYLLGEMLREVDRRTPARTVDDAAGRIRDFVLRRVAALGDATAHLIRMAAAIDGEFDVALLSDIAHGTDQSTAAMVDHATTAGLLHVTGLGSFDFVHDLARRAIVDATDWEERGHLHHAIATVLERRGAAAALVASQWSRAAGAVADAKTIE
ncbi:MAG: transcriptional regulator, putative ATPase, winged helix family, partial [Actinomycetia bacterium]|nr:transcriptional regulator, putative ATPase, winged helix family [Actinomycetes bacterium]